MNQTSDLTDALIAALQQIQVVNQYRTDIGTTVYIGEQTAADVNAPCSVLRPGNETSEPGAYELGSVIIQYAISGYMIVSGLSEHRAIDNMIADIREAIEDQCDLAAFVESLRYEGAERHFHESGSMLSAATARYSMTTRRLPLDLS